MQTSLPEKDLVLLGLGHTNAHVLRMWRMAPLEGVRLTCVSDFGVATYSGMLPGTLAGLYPPGRMEIDLVRLCAAAGARLLRAEVTGLDLQGRQLLCGDRPAIPFDVLSIGVGSVPKGMDRQADAAVVPIKPMQSFIARLDARLQVLQRRANAAPIEIAIVGGGAGGIEIACCLPAHLARHWPNLRFRLTIIDRGAEILPGAATGAVALARRLLAERGVELLFNRSVDHVSHGELFFHDGPSRPVDLAVWAAGAAAPPLLEHLGLPRDEEGFLLTRPTLQTAAEAPIFAVGDSASCPQHPRPKAGVYAVRQGPILWDNIRRTINRQPLVEYRPQTGFLSLLATGDGRAILSYKGFAAHAAWCWKLKDYIDGRFMDKYQDYRPPTMPGPPSAAPRPLVPRCAGCGSKVGSSILSKVLARLDVPASEHVLVGLEAPDDAAILRPVDGRPMIATVDFFTAFVDDPYLVGRVAALNAMSDVFALGGRPLAALAMVTIPPGKGHQQEQLLYELLAGGLRELREAGATLVGGHTIEGDQLTIGYTLLGDTTAAPTRLKKGLRPGDKLLVTKPLGSGILLAAQMRAGCRAEWMESLCKVMLASNERAARLAAEFDIGGMTDVTGFGLAGHLLEMLRASRASAEVDLSALPVLPGVAELVSQGIESTLAPANRAAEAEIEWTRGAQEADARASVLFDPQTSGGLLIGLRPADVEPFLARLSSDGAPPCAVIGEVAEWRDRPLRLRTCPSC
ncbi:MAG TPA: selenide, water dikinase SelD [Pirellulales bacterium]|nr:selenide, water dikinase SelD [Pirellulales bacterium]